MRPVPLTNRKHGNSFDGWKMQYVLLAGSLFGAASMEQVWRKKITVEKTTWSVGCS